MLLTDYFERYSLQRTLAPSTETQYRHAIRCFSRGLNRPATLADLSDDHVNRFLRDFGRSGDYAPDYVRSLRYSLLALWNGAVDDRLIDPPHKVRSISKAAKIPRAWNYTEVQRLSIAARRMPGVYRSLGCTRARWWDLAIRIAWDSGLRRGDQLTALRVECGGDGRLLIVQKKTNKPLPPRQLSSSTLDRLDAFLPAKRRMLCPWPHSNTHFCDEFQRVVQLAGLVGTWKKLRKSSGTAVEAEHPGFGAAHLGDTDAVFRRHYLDPRIAGVRVPGPRPLAG